MQPRALGRRPRYSRRAVMTPDVREVRVASGAVGMRYAGHARRVWRATWGTVAGVLSTLMAVWLALSLSMTAPPAIKTRMFRVGTMPADQAALLKTKLAAVAGVVEAVVLAEEGVAMLKVSLQGWDEAAARILLEATGA